MKKNLLLIAVACLLTISLKSQVEPDAGNWKTWFIKSGKAWRLPNPRELDKKEVKQVLMLQQSITRMCDDTLWQQIQYWNAGSPGYRWQQLMSKLWQNDTSNRGILANTLLSVTTYDATVAAWNTKYAYNLAAPSAVDYRIKALTQYTGTPSFPCEHSVAAGVAATIISYFYPAMADSVHKLAEQAMQSRVAAGAAFPADTRAGFELGKRIAEKEIRMTKGFTPQGKWDGKRPETAGAWKGTPYFPTAGSGKTIMLESSSQFRPGPPPDFEKDMAELKKFKQTFRSTANAFQFATEPVWEDMLNTKIFEYNIQMNPPRAAWIYAICAIGMYDGFIACWDAKYTYWGIRPDQYDTSFHPALFYTPPFPGYPSGHALIGSVSAELYSYFFPSDSTYFRKRAKDGAESRFQGGIHFRTDNEVALDMGRKIGSFIVQKLKRDGVYEGLMFANRY